jgi:hypothetical protein
MNSAEQAPGAKVEVECTDGQLHSGMLCETPMYDKKRLILPGKQVDISAPA